LTVRQMDCNASTLDDVQNFSFCISSQEETKMFVVVETGVV